MPIPQVHVCDCMIFVVGLALALASLRAVAALMGVQLSVSIGGPKLFEIAVLDWAVEGHSGEVIHIHVPLTLETLALAGMLATLFILLLRKLTQKRGGRESVG